MKYLILFVLALLSNTLVKGQFLPGYYIDLNNNKHEGLINDKRISQGKIIFRQHNDSAKLKFTPADIKEYSTLEDTIVSRPFGEQMAFVQIIEKGKIHVYKRSISATRRGTAVSPLLGALTTIHDYYVNKDNRNLKVYSSEIGPEIGSLKQLIPFVNEDSVIVDKIYAKEYKLKDWLQLVIDYNNRAADRKIPGKIIVYRRSKKELDEPIKFTVGVNSISSLTPNSIVELNVSDIYNISLCTEDSICQSFSGSTNQINFLQTQLKKGFQTPKFELVPVEVGEFYKKEVLFFMNKSSKGKKSSN